MTDRALGPLLLADVRLKRLARDIVGRYTGIYADEIVRQQTADGEPVPRIERLHDVACRERPIRHPEEQLPAIILAVPGTTDRRYRSGDGTYAAGYELQVHSVVQATDPDVGEEIAAILALAATKALLDGLPGGLDGRIINVAWRGGGQQELAGDGEDRSRHSATHVLDVTVEPVLSDGSALPDLEDPPIDQPPADPGDLPTVATTELTTTPVEEIDP